MRQGTLGTVQVQVDGRQVPCQTGSVAVVVVVVEAAASASLAPAVRVRCSRIAIAHQGPRWAGNSSGHVAKAVAAAVAAAAAAAVGAHRPVADCRTNRLHRHHGAGVAAGPASAFVFLVQRDRAPRTGSHRQHFRNLTGTLLQLPLFQQDDHRTVSGQVAPVVQALGLSSDTTRHMSQQTGDRGCERMVLLGDLVVVGDLGNATKPSALAMGIGKGWTDVA